MQWLRENLRTIVVVVVLAMLLPFLVTLVGINLF